VPGHCLSGLATVTGAATLRVRTSRYTVATIATDSRFGGETRNTGSKATHATGMIAAIGAPGRVQAGLPVPEELGSYLCEARNGRFP
jgi:hypothetical protein